MEPNDIWSPSRRVWRPKPKRPVQEWCDDCLHLSSHFAEVPGPWRTDSHPHQRGILYVWGLPTTRELNLEMGTQLGKSLIILAAIGHAADNDPGPAMVAHPKKDDAVDFERERLYPMFEASKRSGYVGGRQNHFSDYLLREDKRRFGTVDLREMRVYEAWSGSVSSMGAKSIRYLFLTEIDKYSTDATDEADPEFLVMNRVKAWRTHKILKESTPTYEGSSRIHKAVHETADITLFYHVPCTKCGRFQLLQMGTEDPQAPGLHWDKLDGKNDLAYAHETAYYRCAHCKKRLHDADRYRMLQRGVWAPKDHKIKRGCKALVLWGGKARASTGMHLSSLYSPILDLGALARAFLVRKRSGPEGLRDWENGWMARPWKYSADVPEWTVVQKNLSRPTPSGEVPTWARCLTAGIDLGGKENHWVVRAWGPGGASQLIDAQSIPADINVEVSIKRIISRVLDHGFPMQGGGGVHHVRLALVDSGWAKSTDYVYDICRNLGGRALPLKGATEATGARGLWYITTPQTDRRTLKKPKHGGHKLVMVDSQMAQGWINSKLGLTDDADWFLCEGIHEDYLRSICNVVLTPKPTRDKRKIARLHFVPLDPDLGVHYHDCEQYAMVAAVLLGVRTLPESPPAPRVRKPKQTEDKRFKIRRRPGGFVRRR